MLQVLFMICFIPAMAGCILYMTTQAKRKKGSISSEDAIKNYKFCLILFAPLILYYTVSMLIHH